MAYLRSWALVAIVIATKFLYDHQPFLLEAIGVSNYGLFPIQAHLKSAWELFFLDVVTCVPPFTQFIEKGVYQLQENISNKLHNHSFLSIISYMVSHCMCLRSYVGLGLGAWLFAHPIIPSFCLTQYVFSFVLHTKLNLPHPLTINFTY